MRSCGLFCEIYGRLYGSLKKRKEKVEKKVRVEGDLLTAGKGLVLNGNSIYTEERILILQNESFRMLEYCE